MVAWAGVAMAASEQDVADANAAVQRALAAAQTGDLATAKQQYDAYENTWFDIEDGVRTKSRDSYRGIEKYMADVSHALSATPPNRDQVVTALSDLDREQKAFVNGQPPTSPASSTVPAAVPAGTKPTIASELDLLQQAQAALSGQDYATATSLLQSFDSGWLDVEGEVKTRSADDYRQTENDMALATTLAGQRSPDAAAVVSRVSARLAPYRQASRYSIFDAFIILLREGLEALLVAAALLAVVKRSPGGRGQSWIWGGSFVGLALSVLLGLAIQAFFGAIVNSSNRELMEGVIGLVAAAMLIWVSYWLHSKASAAGWQQYINQRTTAALQGGRLIGLGVLAFLAIFREGAETALFYLGMAGNISTSNLLMGLALGFAALAVIGFLMIVVGVRIPMRPFFTVASLLVFYLCFKFIGAGVHGLQVSGLAPAGSSSFLPSIDPLGMYPTWPTTIAQLLLVAAALLVLLRERLSSPETSPAVAAAQNTTVRSAS